MSTNKKLLNNVGGFVLLAVVGLVLIPLLLRGCGAVATWGVTASETRVSSYRGYLESWSETGLTEHFPGRVPKNAEGVSVISYPGRLQGSGRFQLRMRLPAPEVSRIESEARSRAVRICPEQCGSNISEPGYWSVPDLEAGVKADEVSINFPPDFVVYAFETDGDWNHPTGSGVAISRRRSEVVYWAQSG